MGYDITFHPFNQKEFSYFVDAVVANPNSYDELLQELQNSDNTELINQYIGDSNIESLSNCLKYCIEHQLDLLECSDLYVPAAGECNTLPQNFRANYKKNINDYSNSGTKTTI